MRIPQLVAPIAGTNILRSLPESAGTSPSVAAAALEEFLAKGQRTIALSGAGISVDSNIPDYRGRGLFSGKSCSRYIQAPPAPILSITVIAQYSFTNSSHEIGHVDDIGMKSVGRLSDFIKGQKFSRISSRSASKTEFHAPIIS